MIRPALVLALLLLVPQPPVPASPPGSAASLLRELQRAPEHAGARIYVGTVSPLAGKPQLALYRYERRVAGGAGTWASTHITRDTAGMVVVVQRAEHDVHYALRSASLVHGQTGAVGRVSLSGGEAHYTLEEHGRVRSRREVLREPLVSGPTMFGWILEHWDALAAGRALRIRFALLERGESIPFVLERVPGRPHTTTIEMRPASPVLRLFVAPTRFEFDPASRHILGYAGRVPPMQRVNGRWRTLDARVDYAFAAASFR